MKSEYYFHADDFGRSKEISKNILKCALKGNLNSTSVIVGHITDYYHTKLKKIKNINIRLHLNLTEIPQKKITNNKFLNDLSFFKLIFLKDSYKKKIYDEIESQIKEYKRIYKPKNLKIDGHEHVHMIPWILKYLLKNKKRLRIKEFRNSNEYLFFPRFNDLLNLKYFRNLVACFVLKFFYFIIGSPKLSQKIFIGTAYSNLQSEKLILKKLDLLKKKNIKNFEILLHPGLTKNKDKKLFKKYYFKFYKSINRKKEFDICLSKKIKKKLKLVNEN